MSQLSVSVGATDVQQANAVLSAAQSEATGIDPPVLELGVQSSYQLAYAAYAMAGSTPWQSPTAVSLPYGSPPPGVPSLRIWQLPDSLVNLPQQPTATDQPPLPCLGVQVASVDESTGATVTAPAASYGWATTIGVTVKKLPGLAATPAAATTYELVGANEYDVVLLERILVAIGLGIPGFAVDELVLLHAATGGGSALASDGDGVMTFISQANLTTVTRPPSLLRRTLAAPLPDAPQTAADFVRLLWECSITRSGGFYLYYCTDPVAHTGLPDSIFNDKGEAVLTLLVLHGAPQDPTQQNRVAGYMNAVVTAGFVDPSSSAVSALARALPAYVGAGDGDALATLATTYRMPVEELAGANAGAPVGAPVVVDGGSYQVRPSDPGQDPAAIAAWFGTTVTALGAANPGVDFSQELALWATISLPGGLTVTPGTTGRATLAQIASYYGLTVAALAGANASQPGIFAGQTIEVAELVTPGSGDTLAGVAARYYMDPVQLVEDNADVPLAGGAKVVVDGGLYEVPATAGAGALAAIATRFAIDPSAIASANPALSWTDPQPPLTLVFLPPALTVQAGTSPSAATFGQIASFYGVRLAGLALGNAVVPGLFTVPLRVRGGPLVRQAASPAGTVTYGMTRTAAPAPPDSDPSAFLERLYNLLSYQVPAGLQGFKATTPGPPLGPLTGPTAAGGDKMSQPVDDGIWRYQKAVPYSLLATPPQPDGPGPDPSQSPYLGTGGLLRLEFAWNDLFGNRGLTPLGEPTLDPTAVLNQPPAWALYTDPIVGLSEWPSIGFDYEVVPGTTAGTAQLQISLAFDGCTYLTNVEQGCPQSANPKKVDPVERASRDMGVYAKIFYQQATAAGGGLDITVDTSLLPGGPQAVDAAPLQAFAAAIYEWLAARVGGTTTDPFPTMAPISIPFALSDVEGAQIFELSVALVMSRPPALVDPDLRVESKAAANPSAVPPHQSQDTPGGPYTLDAFAASFEQAMTLAGEFRLKLAVGIDRERAERSGTGAPLWAVRLGLGAGQPLAFSVPDATQPITYAPRPVSNVPRTGSVQVTGYVTGSGLTGPVTTLSFSAIDLDGWTAQLLAAVDRLLSPSYATAIGLIDSALPSGRTAHLQELATAKENLANALKQLVIPVLPGAAGPDPAAAREAFAQQLLIQLGSFYTTDAIVQFKVDALSQATDPTTSPQLFGDLEQTGTQPAPVTLSDPKVPLAQPVAGPPATLTFLLTTAAGQTDVAEQEAQVTLQLGYDGTDVEHQIGTLPGISGYTPSSWLSFVRDETPWPLSAQLGPFDVPLVLRGFPTPPTMQAQSGTQSVADDTPALTLGETLAWDYSLVYSEPFHYQQDTVHLTLEFNHVASGAHRHDVTQHVAATDPLASLAQFVSVYAQVQQDVDTYVAPVDPSKIDPTSQAFIDGDVALTTFTGLADTVAGTLAGAGVSALTAGVLPVESYDLTISEGSLELTSRTGSGAKVEALLVTVGNVPDALGATVAVDIDGCTAQAPPADAGNGDSSSYAYVYVDQATNDWLPASVGETIGPRTVTVPALNVLARQDAWASTWIGRNENAAEPFQYQTPTVYFASPQYPTNLYTEPAIEVASIGASSPQTRTPEAHLAALFAALFAAAPKGEQTIQLECRYEYALSGAGLGPVDLPVYLLAPTAADPTSDLVVPTGGCPADPTQGPLVCRLGGALRSWWSANQPSTSAGVFPLSLTVMSEITGQPLIVLQNLRLTEEWIDWS